MTVRSTRTARAVPETRSPRRGAHLAGDQRPGSTETLAAGEGGTAVVRRTVLPGGLRVVTEQLPGVRSVAVGVWVGVGSRDETRSLAGTSHYLEHLLFKGTRTRSALQISSAIDAVGGELNAFTGKEYTCYYARVLDEDLPLAVDVVCDLVTASVVSSADVEAERGVILEEIAMRDDDPSDVVHEEFAAQLFGDGPLGRPILGTVESVGALTRTAVAGYYRRRYRPQDVVVAASGRLEHAAVVRLVQSACARPGSSAFLEGDARPSPPRGPSRARPATGSGVRLVPRATEQANLVLGVPAVDREDERRFTLSVLSAALGGGMSSRLFQEVRERRGLAYSVYSYAQQHADTGLFGIYAGCQPGKVDEVLTICRAELARLADEGLTEEELVRAKGQLAGSLVLGLEDTGSRMNRLGKSELVHGRLMTVEESLQRIDEVTGDDVLALAGELLTVAPTLAVVGPFDAERDFSAHVCAHVA